MRGGGDGEGGGVAGEDGYAGKVEEYCSWGQERVEHLYWCWRQ